MQLLLCRRVKVIHVDCTFRSSSTADVTGCPSSICIGADVRRKVEALCSCLLSLPLYRHFR